MTIRPQEVVRGWCGGCVVCGWRWCGTRRGGEVVCGGVVWWCRVVERLRARSCPVVHGAPFTLACGPDMPHRPVVTGVERRSPPRERPSMHLTRLSLAGLGLRSDARARSMRTNTSNTLVLFSHSTDHHARGALLTFVKLENQRAMSITSARHASRQHGRLQPCTAREPPRTPQKHSPPNVERQ